MLLCSVFIDTVQRDSAAIVSIAFMTKVHMKSMTAVYGIHSRQQSSIDTAVSLLHSSSLSAVLHKILMRSVTAVS